MQFNSNLSYSFLVLLETIDLDVEHFPPLALQSLYQLIWSRSPIPRHYGCTLSGVLLLPIELNALLLHLHQPTPHCQ
jgi:hypothetical protein